MAQLRVQGFTVEQECLEQEVDGQDHLAHHLLGYLDNKLAVYLRVFPAGVKFQEVTIGRVVANPSIRGQGLGRTLMEKGLQQIKDMCGDIPVRISAQANLEKFYQSLGFEAVRGPYQEDGIPHFEMLLDIKG